MTHDCHDSGLKGWRSLWRRASLWGPDQSLGNAWERQRDGSGCTWEYFVTATLSHVTFRRKRSLLPEEQEEVSQCPIV